MRSAAAAMVVVASGYARLVAYAKGTPSRDTPAGGAGRLPPKTHLTGRHDDGRRYRRAVGTKAQRRAARDRVDTYHEARLGELVEHIAGDLDRYRTGEIDAYTLDETIHHYHRAARELWKFCFRRRWHALRDHRPPPREDGHRRRHHRLVGPGHPGTTPVISAYHPQQGGKDNDPVRLAVAGGRADQPGWPDDMLADVVPALDVARVQRWCGARVPERARHQVRVECD